VIGMESTPRQVFCKNCGQPIDEKPLVTVTARKPCPSCGGLWRHFDIVITTEVGLAAYLQTHSRHGRVRSKGRRRPAREEYRGDDLTVAMGRWAILRRVIDRVQKLYIEKIWDRETGSLLVNKIERLDAHIGHGSAKVSKRKR